MPWSPSSISSPHSRQSSPTGVSAFSMSCQAGASYGAPKYFISSLSVAVLPRRPVDILRDLACRLGHLASREALVVVETVVVDHPVLHRLRERCGVDVNLV